MSHYSASLEIAGPCAIWTRPDSGASFVSYPAPTFSAAQGILDSVARWKTAYLEPERVEICTPIQTMRYATNYGGPLRNPAKMNVGYQLYATILIDVCYKIHAVARESATALDATNHLHALQELFCRRLKQGKLYQMPCLGMVGDDTQLCGARARIDQGPRRNRSYPSEHAPQRVQSAERRPLCAAIPTECAHQGGGAHLCSMSCRSCGITSPSAGFKRLHGIPGSSHLAKYATFLVELDSMGQPTRVAFLPREQAAHLHNIQPDNQKSFPAFNLNAPIFELTKDVAAGPANLRVIAGALDALPLAYKKKDLDRLKRLLENFPAGEIVPLFPSGGDPVLDSTVALLDALRQRTGAIEEFLRKLASCTLQSAMRGDLPAEAVLDVLFGKLAKNGSRKPWQCILYLDLHDLSGVSHRVADPAVAAAWSEAMLTASENSGAGAPIRCALTGQQGHSASDKMPNPNLPLLGGTYLLSMNPDVPCQTRYGRTSTEVFPVTQETVQGVNDALLHITHPDRRGKTWSAVPNGTGDEQDLLIAYLEKGVESQLSIVPLLGSEDGEWPEEGDSGPDLGSVSPFEERTKKLIEALHLREQNQGIHDDYLRLFVLSKIDEGRRQVLFDARYSVDRIYRAQERWLGGSGNAPEIDTLLLQGKGKKPLRAKHHVPSPGAVVASFRQQWIRAGVRSQKVAGVNLSRIYALLLDDAERAKRQAAWLLERFLPLKVDLILGAGRPAVNQKTEAVYTYTAAGLPDSARRDLLIAVATFGILLRALGRNKEDYMNERDFLLGQFLQFADRLHIFYCEGVRDGQVPPQLIGNAHISMAMQSPRRALNVLAERMPVYLAYAKQAAYGKQSKESGGEIKRAKWIERRLGEISQKLNELGFDGSSDDVGKAELLLGYLAVPATIGSDANEDSKATVPEEQA